MKVDENPDHVKARAYFRRILGYGGDSIGLIVAVAHLVDSAIPFIPTLNEKYPVQVLLGKPSSIQPEASHVLATALRGREHYLDKSTFKQDPAAIIRETFPALPAAPGVGVRDVVLLDIGGYFAQGSGLESVNEALIERGYTLAGVVEDTQNGEHRYRDTLESIEGARYKVFSVARSPLKRPENHLVGVAISFSVEAILRQSNIVLQSRRAGVIGFGPIGRSVAHSLRNRGLPVSVCERDPVQLATAAAQGFTVFDYEAHFEEFARGINLVVSSTGAGAKLNGKRPINSQTIGMLRSGTFIASVTSQDDEIDMASLVSPAGLYTPIKLRYNDEIQKLIGPVKDGQHHSVFLMAEGNAINFRHGGVIGPAIQLLQGEILACVNYILSSESRKKRSIQELPDSERARVARAWLDHYLMDSSATFVH